MPRVVFAVLVLLLTTAPVAAQGFTIPEETVVRFYDLIYGQTDNRTNRDTLDRRFCNAYDLLASPTRQRIEKGPFVLMVWAHRSVVHREGMEVGVAVYNDDRSVAKVPVMLRLASWLVSSVPGPGGNRPTFIETLTKEDSQWRLLMPDERVTMWLESARRVYKRAVSCAGWLPSTPAAAPTSQPTPAVPSQPGNS